ncbi:MAG TPA: hypothetical protein VFB32_17285 [Rudaea sp.]|nr:hypothetical protein [Rudaea sp.]
MNDAVLPSVTYCDAGEIVPFVSPLDVTVRAGGVTTSVAGALVLPTKLLSPSYCAVTDFVPVEVGVKSQLPTPPDNVIAQLAPVPSLTVTDPVGVTPLPATNTDTVVALPIVIGLGGSKLVIVVVEPRLPPEGKTDAVKPVVARLDDSSANARTTLELDEYPRI